jgi:hypothetical protein
MLPLLISYTAGFDVGAHFYQLRGHRLPILVRCNVKWSLSLRRWRGRRSVRRSDEPGTGVDRFGTHGSDSTTESWDHALDNEGITLSLRDTSRLLRVPGCCLAHESALSPEHNLMDSCLKHLSSGTLITLQRSIDP